MKENTKLGIFQSGAFLASLLALIFTALPGYFETGYGNLTILQQIFGNEKTEFNIILLLAFILLIIGCLLAAVLAVLCFLNKFNSDKLVTILSIVSAALILIGGVILSLSIFITGLDKSNSELGFIQGNWGLGIGNILLPIFALIAIGLSYPCCMIIPHHKDLADKSK
ncbi:MAG: hypothetical protein WCR67_01785 [Bacilli bacterium]